ncbi:MAG: hypothetical protein JNK89_01645 [Saprospiraceae bacterium]|nr:hypothetical protein [Saprospiraceae bacterium]
MVQGPDKVIGLRQLMEKRAEYLKAHPALTKAGPEVVKVNFKITGEKVLFTAELKNAEGAWLFYRNHKMFAFTRVAMADKGENGDAKAGDGIFSLTLPLAQAAHYYVVAENADAVTLYPERASFEYITVAKK